MRMRRRRPRQGREGVVGGVDGGGGVDGRGGVNGRRGVDAAAELKTVAGDESLSHGE